MRYHDSYIALAILSLSSSSSVFCLNVHALAIQVNSETVQPEPQLPSRPPAYASINQLLSSSPDEQHQNQHHNHLTKRAGRRWTAEEEDRLLRLRAQNIPWDELVSYFDGRTWDALSQKYKRLTAEDRSQDSDSGSDSNADPDPDEDADPNTETETETDPPSSPPAKWTPDEDKLLAELVAQRDANGNRALSWQDMVPHFDGQRTARAIQAHHYYLNKPERAAPKAVLNPFTPAEDELLFELLERQVSWEVIYGVFAERTEWSVMGRARFLLREGYVPDRWTADEDRFLRRGGGGGGGGKGSSEARSWPDLAAALGRDEERVRQRAWVLERLSGVSLAASKQRTMTPEELERVHRARQEGLTWAEVTRRVFPDGGRSANSVGKQYRKYYEGRGGDGDRDGEGEGEGEG